MKKLLLLLTMFFIGNIALVAQITPNGNSGSSTTAYTNGSPNNPIYIWCATGLANNTASLTATPASGTGPFTFNWYYHNQTNASWTFYSTTNGATSTLNNLPSDAYRVQIYDNLGVLVACYTALVWNMNGQVTAAQTPSACNGSNLTGTVASNGSFTYYNPPPPESLISASTTISVCFSATHTFVSDLAFYLVGPASCGNPTVLLSPNPGANGQGSICNGGNNVSNLCFTTSSASILNVCTASVPLTGTYGGYGAGAGTLINWSGLYGCNAAQGGWTVQIFDCIGADVGSLTNASISFSNLTSICSSPTALTYSSGAINSPINDNSCSAASASVFQVPVSPLLTTPITINATTTYLWTASPATTIPNASSSLTPSVTNIGTGTTTFTLTGTVTYGATSCTYPASIAFLNTCCTAIADAGPDVSFCSTGNAQIGTPAVANMTYSWSPTTGLNNPTSAQPIVTLTNGSGSPSTTVYTVTATNTVDGGCTANDAVNVTVNPIPAVNAGIDQSVCPSTSVTLSGAGATTYTWNSGVTNGVAFNPAVGSVTYTVTGTTAGCTNTDQVVVTVNALPVVNAGTYGPVCSGSSAIALSGTPAGGTYSGTGVTGSSFNPASGSQTITYSYTDANTCTNTANTTITVNPLPTISGTLSACMGSGSTLTGSATPGATPWSSSNTAAATINSAGVVSALSAGTTTITYTNSNACVITATYTVNANPTISGTMNSCIGGTSNLTGSGTPGATPWTSSNTSVATITSGGVVSGLSAGTSTITYANSNGCLVTGTFTVNGSAVISGNLTPCLGTNPTLTGSGTPGATPWSSSNNAVATITSGGVVTSLTVGSTTITYTSSAGCTGTATLTVNPLPTISGTLSACIGSGTTLTGSASPGATPWTSSNTTVATITSAGVVSALAAGTSSITYTNSNGCIITATYTVNPLPVVTAGNYTAVCIDGADIVLAGTPAGGTFSGTGVTANAFDPSVGSQTILYTYTNANSCTNSATAPMMVNTLPNINGGADQTVCIGSNMTLSGSGGSTYAWNNGVINGQAFSPSLGSTTYTVTGTDANGCVNTDDVLVTALSLPNANVLPDVTSGYPTLIVNFTNSSANSNSYAWNFGNGTTGTSTNLSTQMGIYPTPGTYQIILQASNGICSDADTVIIIVIPFPDPILHLPNVFSPNNDGSNDYFFIENEYVAELNYYILNRWGNVVFETGELIGKWDGQFNGKDSSEGVYFIKYTATGINGDLVEGHGNITLIR